MTGNHSIAAGTPPRIPPGRRHVHGWPVSHYGPVPRFRPERWNLRVHGATATGTERIWTFDELTGLPHRTVVADLHCATGPTSANHECYGMKQRRIRTPSPVVSGCPCLLPSGMVAAHLG